MFYKVLGMVVWNGGKFVLRRRNHLAPFQAIMPSSL